MSKAQYILFIAIIGFYGALFVALLVRSIIGLWPSRKRAVFVKPQMENISRVAANARNRAWTRAVWRGTLAHETR